jgi:hypothetical protein
MKEDKQPHILILTDIKDKEFFAILMTTSSLFACYFLYILLQKKISLQNVQKNVAKEISQLITQKI